MKLTNHDALLVVVLERRQRPTRWSPVGGQEPGVAFAKGKGKCTGLSMDCLSSISRLAFTFFSLWIVSRPTVPASQVAPSDGVGFYICVGKNHRENMVKFLDLLEFSSPLLSVSSLYGFV
jgi:hypothetical protein